MRKLSICMIVLFCVVLCASCRKEQANYITSVVPQNTLAALRSDTLTAIPLSDEDVNILTELLRDSNQETSISDCEKDCVIHLDGRYIYYHSVCGTFTEYEMDMSLSYSSISKSIEELQTEMKVRCFYVSDKATVNAILTRYIALDADSHKIE